MVRSVVLDMKFHGAQSLNEEKRSSALIKVTEYLRPIWQSNLTEKLHVTFENHNGFIQDLDAFNKVFRFLQLGSIKIKKYHHLVHEIYIKGDGSSGIISWGPRPLGDDILPAVYCNSVEFLTTDSGLRLLPQLTEQALQLVILPVHVQYKIYGMVLQQVNIDADKTVSPLCPLLYVSREFRMSRENYLNDVNLIDITTSTTLTETTFSDFKNLRKLARKMFDFKLPQIYRWTPLECIPVHRPFDTLADRCRDTEYSGGPPCKLQFNLYFNICEIVMLEDLRISILPFIMETSYFSGKTSVVISIFSEQASTMVRGATHCISLHTIRSRVVAALTATIDALELNFHCVSNACINGRGEVVDFNVNKITYGYGHLEKPKFALKIVEHGPMGPYEIADEGVHPLDVAYRGPHWTWTASCHRYYDQFFPFTQSPNETLQYLQWVLDPKSVPSN